MIQAKPRMKLKFVLAAEGAHSKHLVNGLNTLVRHISGFRNKLAKSVQNIKCKRLYTFTVTFSVMVCGRMFVSRAVSHSRVHACWGKTQKMRTSL